MLAILLGLSSSPTVAQPLTAQGELTAIDGGLVDADHPPLPIGSKLPTTLTANFATPPAPETLTEHGDATALRGNVVYAQPTAAKAPSLTAAAAAAQVTVASCNAAFPNGTGAGPAGVIIDHYNWCFVATCLYYTVDSSGVVKGTTTMRCTQAGNGTTGQRTILLTSGRDKFVDSGDAKVTAAIQETWTTSGYSGTDGSNVACNVDGNSPKTRPEWAAGSKAVFVITSAAAGGYSRDSVSRCGIAGWSRSDLPPWGSMGQQGVRMDSASYLGSNGAGIFDRVVPIMQEYSVTSTRNGAVAQHVLDAQSNPNSTYPPKPDGSAKVIPGAVSSGAPLTRLMSTWDAAATARYNANRSKVTSTCASLSHNADEECDEYPFASTWQGAGKGDGNFSVRYVDGTQNGNAGTDLNNWYIADRILHNDKFYVYVK
ncbi:NucA/NucB deoxyribonuclease domain-containing protein [Streptomyces sp. NPDC007162]|uniref:NucA/NucB deoxyribonuclease domain-containing protein n=1 Tax=Streptomyces sp. NPDC007162 TaxID=3156917 RepID=UPI00340B0B5A